MSFESSVTHILPQRLSNLLSQALGSEETKALETLRIRRDKPLSITLGGLERFVTESGCLEDAPVTPLCPTATEVDDILSLATRGSLYSVETEMRRGYLTLPGGHRLGIAGEAVLDNEQIKSMKHISSVQVRVAHEVKGCADALLEGIVRGHKDRPLHTLIIGPPGAGKTTLLRDLARQLSDGTKGRGSRGFQVAVADERSEIAGTYRGQVQLDVGRRTDVIDGAPKAVAMSMLVRSMAPDVIVTDEIGAADDAAAVADVLRCGVTLIASAHAADMTELTRRPILRELLHSGAFQRVAILSRRRGVGTLERLIDLDKAPIMTSSGRWQG